MSDSTTNGLRVGYITQWFHPEPGRVPLSIAQSLQQHGMDVRVLTGVPNYPTGRIYPGYSARRFSREIVEGVPVSRTPLVPAHGKSSIGRAVNLTSFAASSTVAMRHVLRNCDVNFVYSSPVTAALPAMVARRRWGTPYVMLILDMWPDSVFASGFLNRGWKRRLAEDGLTWFSAKAYQGASHVGVTSPGMADLLKSRGVPEQKISLVYNWADEEIMRPAALNSDLRNELGVEPGFLLMYAGNHGLAQRLDNAIRAMELLRDRPDVHLCFVGDGAAKPALIRLGRTLGLTNVHFQDSLPAERVPALMAAADMQLVTLADQDLFKITMPSKLQNIMACAAPILLAGAGDAARAVEVAGAGLTCPPGSPSQLADAIRKAAAIPRLDLQHMGTRGFEYYRTHFSKQVNSTALAKELRAAAVTEGNVRASTGSQR